MAYRKKRVKHEDIAKSVIADLPTEKLEESLKFIGRLRKWRSKSKLYTTYAEGVRKSVEYNGHNKVYCDFRLEGTVTGRLSCGGYKAGKNPKGVSFHTLPRSKEDNIRHIFVAPEGWDFIAADYGQMEMRIMAHASQDPNLIQAFYSGEDLHRYTASLLFNKEPHEVTKNERQMAKSVSFLIIYGGGAFRLTQEVGVSMAKAEETIARYKEVFPGVFQWMAQTIRICENAGFVESFFGRKRHLTNIRSRDNREKAHAERQAVNFVIQSSASDILCFCLLDIIKEFNLRGMESRVVATVHDSIEVVSPRYDTEEAIGIVRDKLLNYPTLKRTLAWESTVPFLVDVELGTTFGNGREVEFEGNNITNWKELTNDKQTIDA